MKNEVLDILILGLLVVLFASIYRKRASARLRYWVIAWILVLLHFAALLVPATSVQGQELVDSLSISALLLSGLCFLFSASAIFQSPAGSALAGLGIGVPGLFYTNYLIFGGAHLWPLYLAAAACSSAGVLLAWKLCRGRSGVLVIRAEAGAGKTALMVEANRAIQAEGYVSVWINLQTLRHESSSRAFLLICQSVCDRILTFYSRTMRAPHVLVSATALRDELEKLTSLRTLPETDALSLIPRMQHLIRRFLDTSSTQLYIFLDELHYLPRAEQPRLLDMLHGSIRDCNAWLKIAGIRHLSRWFQTSPPLGLQTGHDADHIDLDITLEDPLKAKKFLEQVLRSYTKHVGVSSLGNIFSPESLDRLVIASGAVPRDYLVLSAQAVSQAQRREKARLVGVQDVNKVAGDAAKVKIAELEDDAASAKGTTQTIVDALQRVRSFCIDERSYTYFRIDFRDKENRVVEYSVMQDLMDMRLIHMVDASLSDERQAGRRSEVYMLDLSQFSGQRLKRRLKVLDFESGRLVLKETGTSTEAKVAGTPKQRLGLLRRGPLFELKNLGTVPSATG